MFAKIRYIAMQHFNFCLVRNWKLRLKLSFLVIKLHKKTTNWISNRTGIVKKKHIFEAEPSNITRFVP